MAIDETGEWWIGSEPADIQSYLILYTAAAEAYPATAYRPIRCRCGTDGFRVERAGSVTRRTCASCGDVDFICRSADRQLAWEGAAAEEAPESLPCVNCESDVVNIGLGFAGYPEPEVDAVKWLYVGVRCAACGVLGCFNDSKVARGPSAQVCDELAANK